MKKLLFSILTLSTAYVYAQTCIVPAPATPPKATTAIIKFTNPDGGGFPCEIAATGGGAQQSAFYPVVQAARCNTAKAMADQALAKSNGWDDGGSP